jgi:hypothetical protein
MKKLLVILLLSASAASAQQPPIVTASNKFQWNQPAQDLNTAQGYGYKWYLDGSATGNQFSGVLCTGVSPSFTCQVQVPPLTQGTHTIRLSATNAAGESPLSDPFAFAFVGLPAKPEGVTAVPGGN